VSARAGEIAAWGPRVQRTRAIAAEGARRLAALPPPAVLGTAIVIEWLAVLGLALKVRHNGWIYYQGGDQLWYYSLGWLLGHGHLWQTPVGYLWSFVLLPFARVAGPDVASALPGIVLLNVLVLLPAAMLALYGIAARLGGRLFGYWTLLVWIVVPFIGVLYTDTGYHQRYTEVILPQGLGLTAMADFPAMVATVVALYFCARVVLDARPSLLDGVAGGLAFGAAIGLKPSVALVLLGPPLAFVARRQFVALACFAGGLLPALLALAFWKARGLGQIPLLHAEPAHVPAGIAAVLPAAGINLNRYTHLLSWHELSKNIDLLREHFWSGHGAVWLVLAGLIAIGLRSRPAALLIGGSFLPFTIVKSSYIASIEDTSLFRILIPAFPMFVLGLAALPYLLPGTRRRAAVYTPVVRVPSQRVRLGLLGAVVLLTGIVPIAATAAARRSGGPPIAVLSNTQMPVPVNVRLGLHAKTQAGRVLLTWREVQPAGGAVFYRVWRLPATADRGLACGIPSGAVYCTLATNEVGVTRQGARYDTPPRGTWVYRVGVAANWLDDPAQGDVYFASEPVVVRVP